ncbi:hypothetical protein CO051_07120 [Candidatus Roizmanbacteria bacterium CG_4_9_14_0_2_um_filter_39_13]|uniref:Uncharacterized protein n=1 Tax=Candidatus Roizmanbacteria bacterium CG_4_9_14_0_2_um_filter_39_13 TaxID=1974839 RepID=A0A2M8EWD8_9BACT|nr:MAG: hypothetical protein CO051_07120 [Candidatus Roizmanbacteria bacterium CG_4_9_14_0_2_um_filter_39_13]
MEFNRLISLILGFIILILAFVWISNKFRANKSTVQTNQPTITVTIAPTEKVEAKTENRGWNPFAFLFDKQTPTPTQTNTSSNTNKAINGATITPKFQTKVNVIEKEQMRDISKTNQPTGVETISKTYTNTNMTTKNPTQQIPETGAFTALLPILSLMLAGGIAMKKSS